MLDWPNLVQIGPRFNEGIAEKQPKILIIAHIISIVDTPKRNYANYTILGGTKTPVADQGRKVSCGKVLVF